MWCCVSEGVMCGVAAGRYRIRHRSRPTDWCVEFFMDACFLVGATAVGKSAVAQFLAVKRGDIILSADSMLIYRGMDIGTAKPSVAERGSVPYYGVDLVDPSDKFSAWDYRQHALKVLADYSGGGRGVIVTGGTGLYVKSLTHGLEDRPGADLALRKKWERRVEEEGIGVLQDALRDADSVAFESLVDRENPRRLIRALESVGSQHKPQQWSEIKSEAMLVGLSMEPKLLHDRIALRVEIMYSEGLVAEVEVLLASEQPMSDTARQAIGYSEAIDFIEGRMTQAEAMERTVIRTRRLAKRQRTWFRNQAQVAWVDVTPDSSVEELADQVEALWEKFGKIKILKNNRKA